MYDLSYVKKRRRKKIAALVSLFTAVGITSLVIISFLGRTVGTFSIKLTNSDVQLSLCNKASFDKPSSYLYVDSVSPLRETTFANLPEPKDVDNEEAPTEMQEAKLDDGSIYFLKYTFYIRNTGNSIAKYNLSINLSDKVESNDGTHRYIDDTLRIMVFENDPTKDTHDYRVFARDNLESTNYVMVEDEQGNTSKQRTSREFISEIPENRTEDDQHPLAESFASETIAAKYEVGNFGKGDVKRYTIVLWLEGEDPNAKGIDEPPEGATLKLGVNIAAYENA